MKYNPKIHHRKTIRLKEYDYSQEGLYFVTICTKDMINHFGNIKEGEMFLSEIGHITDKFWKEIPKHFPNVILDEYVIMPNHIHGIIEINDVGNRTVGNNDYCSKTDGNKNVGNKNVGNKNVGNKNVGNKNVGNKNFCSLPDDNQIWQKQWARSLSSIIRGFKIGVTKWCRQNVGNNNHCSNNNRNNNHCSNNNRNNNHCSENNGNNDYCSLPFIWQKSFYDHIIRDEKSLNNIRVYIINNPGNWEKDRNNPRRG